MYMNHLIFDRCFPIFMYDSKDIPSDIIWLDNPPFIDVGLCPLKLPFIICWVSINGGTPKWMVYNG